MSDLPELAQFALRRRLLVLILVPLALIGGVNAWTDLRLAGSASRLQDEQISRLMPMFATAVLSTPPDHGLTDSIVMLVPELQQFIVQRGKQAAFRVSRVDGKLLAGDPNISAVTPLAGDVELHTELRGATAWRVAAQRLQLAEGQDVVIQVADGSDPRRRWFDAVLWRVILPNLLTAFAVYVGVSWGVRRALAPLVDLQRAVERRAPQDLSAIDVQGVPREVSPLVMALNRLVANAKYQGDAQRRFVADAAHQLRTPLAAVHTEVQALTMGARQGDADLVLPRATVQRLEQATRRAATLTHQLLTLSRAEDAAASPAMETVLLQDVIHEVLALRLDEAHARQADLGTDVAQDAQQAYVLAQPWMLKELLLNLVDNALRYASAPAVVTIGAKRISDQAVEAYVADNGPGIPEAERDLVLERFYRAKGNLVDGNGLGLAIAQEIAERHGARLVLRDAQPDAKSPGLWIGLALPLASRANPAPGDELAVRK